MVHCEYCANRADATRNVIWAHIPAHVSSTSQQVVLTPNGAESFQGGGDNIEAEEESVLSSEAESQSHSAEDNYEFGGEGESEDASEG